MNVKPLVTGILLLLAAAGVVYVLVGGEGDEGGAEAVATVADADGLPNDGVVVYYFHGNKRCYTCNKMEALADQVLYDRFGDRLRDGSVVFKPVNVEAAATRHYIQDFAMTNRCVVMETREGGEQHGWRRLDAVWEKISDDAEYTAYIAENLTACLVELGLGDG